MGVVLPDGFGRDADILPDHDGGELVHGRFCFRGEAVNRYRTVHVLKGFVGRAPYTVQLIDGAVLFPHEFNQTAAAPAGRFAFQSLSRNVQIVHECPLGFVAQKIPDQGVNIPVAENLLCPFVGVLFKFRGEGVGEVPEDVGFRLRIAVHDGYMGNVVLFRKSDVRPAGNGVESPLHHAARGQLLPPVIVVVAEHGPKVVPVPAEVVFPHPAPGFRRNFPCQTADALQIAVAVNAHAVQTRGEKGISVRVGKVIPSVGVFQSEPSGALGELFREIPAPF